MGGRSLTFMNINNISVPADVIAQWRRKEANAVAKHRQELIDELQQTALQEETDMPTLRAATAEARQHEDVVRSAYVEAQEATRVAYGAELEAVAHFEHKRTKLSRELLASAPACVAEFIEV